MKKSTLRTSMITLSAYMALCSYSHISSHDSSPQKIVALVPVHNEELLIEDCLRALTLVADAIIVLDDASEDSTLAIVKRMQKECNIERIYEKKKWFRDEPGDKNMLLKLGREIGGTHFMVIDADEMFTATTLKNNFLKNKILEMQPGDRLAFHWIRLWKSIKQFRIDGELKDFIFCDDGTCFYESDFIHTPRVPNNLTHGQTIHVKPYITYGLLHFQAVNWRNMELRQAWYRCLVRIRKPELPTHNVNRCGNNTKVAPHTQECPQEWFEGYTFFNQSTYEKPDTWREKQILGWFKQFGKQFFADLDIWHIDWQETLA